MNLLLSAYACRPNTGTEPGVGWSWAWHLAQQGNEVWCFTGLHNRSFVETYLRKHPMAHLHMVYVATPLLIEWLRRKHFRMFSYLHYWFWQRAAYRYARRLRRHVAFDVVHHATYGSLQMGSLLWKLNLPFIFGPVGGGQSAPRAFRSYLKKGWYVEQLRTFFSNSVLVNVYHTAATLRSAGLVLTTNDETYARARQLGARNVKMALDSGLPVEFYPPQVPERPATRTLRLLWVGSMLPRKGVSLLLDVIAPLPDTITLTLVGGGVQEKLIRARIDQLGIGHRVSCTGRVPFEQIKDYYASHDVFIFCSLRDSFGTQLLEAMAYGLPIITLDHQGAHTFVPDRAGIKVPPTDIRTTIARLQEAIRYLQAHPDERAAMGQCGYAFALRHQWPKKVRDMMHEYDHFLQYS